MIGGGPRTAEGLMVAKAVTSHSFGAPMLGNGGFN